MSDKQQLAAMGVQYRLTEEQAKGLAERMPQTGMLHILDDEPMCMAKRIEELEAQVRVMGGALNEFREFAASNVWDDAERGALLASIDSALSGKLLEPAIPDSQQPKPCMPELDDNLRLILGRPNFSCITIAKALRIAGHAIEQKAEHEQAAVIHWLLGFYFSHGDNWIDASRAALKDMRDAAMLAAAPSPDSAK